MSTAPFPAIAIAPTALAASRPTKSSPLAPFIQTPEEPLTWFYTRYSITNRKGSRAPRGTFGRTPAGRPSSTARAGLCSSVPRVGVQAKAFRPLQVVFQVWS